MKVVRLVGFASTLIFLSSADSFSQCALCRDAVASANPATREAFNYAILGLAFVPYGVVAAAAWLLSPALRTRVRGVRLRLGIRARNGR